MRMAGLSCLSLKEAMSTTNPDSSRSALDKIFKRAEELGTAIHGVSIEISMVLIIANRNHVPSLN